jgi:ribosomal protein S18 acetylase RimI-like enzyme
VEDIDMPATTSPAQEHPVPSTPAPLEADSPIRRLTAADANRAFDLLTLAFENDPPSRWIWQDRRQFLEAFPRFAKAFGGVATDLGTAHCFGDFGGISLWLPPGVFPDEEALADVIEQTLSGDRREAMYSIIGQMELYHPVEPHWHLPLMGVVPEHQGRGIGSALLRRMLERCDREQLPAYLEATSSRNILLYARQGFEAAGCIQVEDCPPIVPMVRQPH